MATLYKVAACQSYKCRNCGLTLNGQHIVQVRRSKLKVILFYLYRIKISCIMFHRKMFRGALLKNLSQKYVKCGTKTVV